MSTETKTVRFERTVTFDRVSSMDQRDGYSLDAQRDHGAEYAKKNNLAVIKSWSVDESASKEEVRIHFFDMIDFVKKNNIEVVLFDKVDRACRGLKSAVLIEDLIDNHDVRFHFTREHLVIDKNSPPQEKFRFYLGIVMAKYYVDNLKTEIKKGINARVAAGVWSGKAPFGYQNVRTGIRSTIEVEPIEFQAGKEVFARYKTGNYSFEDLAKYISDNVPKRKRKNRKDVDENGNPNFKEVEFTKRLVEEMISNPFYYGAMRIKNKLHEGSHTPMVDKETFDACQKLRAIRAANSHKRKEMIPKAFMQMFICGDCDHAITGESVKKYSGKTYVYYRCANAKCAQYKNRIEQKQLFDLAKKAFEPFKKWTPKATKSFIEAIHGSLDDLELYTRKMTGGLADARIELKKRIEALNQLKTEGRLSQAEYDTVIAVPMKLLADNSAEIQSYQEADLATFKKGVEVIQLFQKAYDYMQIDGCELEKIKLIKAVLSNPKLKNRSIEFSYTKPLDVLLDLTSAKIWWALP